MLMAIDVGNTNITIGIFQEEFLAGTFRLTTGIPRTSDEYGVAIGEILETNGIPRKQVKDAIIASVVPAVMHSLVLHGIITRTTGLFILGKWHINTRGKCPKIPL